MADPKGKFDPWPRILEFAPAFNAGIGNTLPPSDPPMQDILPSEQEAKDAGIYEPLAAFLHNQLTNDVETLNGDAFTTADLVGRPLIINSWYSTCVPCKKELPAFAQAHGKFGDRVRFVGIDSLSPSAQEEAFARDKGVQYELLYDTDGKLSSEIGVAAWPQTLFINAEGTIVEQTGELTADKLEELIRTKLL